MSYADRMNQVRRTWKFTLIELLVVISIIAILAGMLLPALNSAKKTAQSIACTNQVKQLGMGMINYTNTFQEYLPCSARYNSEGVIAASGDIYHLVTQVVGETPKGDGSLPTYSGNQTNIHSKGLSICPADFVPKGTDGTTLGGWHVPKPGEPTKNNWLRTSYGTSKYVFRGRTWPGNVLQHWRLTQFRHPSKTLTLHDSNTEAIVNNSLYTQYGAWQNHNGAINILWLDGHVASRKVGKYSTYGKMTDGTRRPFPASDTGKDDPWFNPEAN